MTKRKVQQPVKTGQIPKDKVEDAVKKVLNAPGSSKAAKTTKGTSLSSKPKSPTLKEQVNNWKELYTTLSDDYAHILNELSRKDMELANNKSDKDFIEDLQHALKESTEDYKKLHKTYGELYYLHYTPWYTKLLNFFKGD